MAPPGRARENPPQPARSDLTLAASMKQDRKLPWYVRPAFAAIGLGLVSMALAPLFRGHRFYTNYFGDLVFAPIALLLESFVLYLEIFRWDRVLRAGRDESTGRKGR